MKNLSIVGLLGVAALAGCGAGAPGPTIPAAPTVPPAATVGPNPTQAGPGQTAAQSQAPAGPEGNLCDIVSLDEVSAAAGGRAARLAEDADQEGHCTWDVGQSGIFPELPAANIELRRDFADALEQQRELFPGGEDVAVGDDGYWTPELLVLHFIKGGTDYAVQVGAYDLDEGEERSLAIAIGELAAPRL